MHLLHRPSTRCALTVDDRPVDVADWEADVAADGGPRTLTARIGREARWAVQEAPVTLWGPSGRPIWDGTLPDDPMLRDGALHLRAEGPRSLLAAQPQPLLYRLDGGGEWVPSDAEPHSYNNNEKVDVDATPGRLAFIGQKGESYADGNQAGLLIWTEDCPIRRVRVLVHKDADQTAFFLRAERATGPSGSLQNVDTRSLAAGNPSGSEWNVNPGVHEDLIRISYEKDGADASLNNRRKVWLKGVRVYGLTIDDNLTVSDVLTDIFAGAGFDASGVQPSGIRILPLYWTEEHDALAEYLTELVDWWWMITPRDDHGVWGARAGAWTDADTVYRTGARVDLPPMRRYNQVVVPFEDTAGRERRAVFDADPNPLPGKTVTYTADALADPQPDDILATAVASSLMTWLSSERRVGTVEVAEAFRDGFRISPYELEPGRLVDVADHDPQIDPQRIQAVRFLPGGVVRLEVSEELSVADEIFRVRRNRRRRRRRRKRG